MSRVDLSARPFGVWVGDPTAAEPTYQGESIILSTGAQALMLGIDREGELIGHGVSTCATCDGFFFRDHDIAVVGGGDSALEEAIFLTKFARSVTVVHRRDELRASKIMQDRAFANPKITFRWNSVVEAVDGESTLAGVTVRDVLTDERTRLPMTGLFVAIGHKPNTDLFKGQLEMEESGYLVTGLGEGATTHQRRGRVRLPATCRTTSTARRSRLPAPAARRPSTPSAGSRRSTTGDRRGEHRQCRRCSSG